MMSLHSDAWDLNVLLVLCMSQLLAVGAGAGAARRCARLAGVAGAGQQRHGVNICICGRATVHAKSLGLEWPFCSPSV